MGINLKINSCSILECQFKINIYRYYIKLLLSNYYFCAAIRMEFPNIFVTAGVLCDVYQPLRYGVHQLRLDHQAIYNDA